MCDPRCEISRDTDYLVINRSVGKHKELTYKRCGVCLHTKYLIHVKMVQLVFIYNIV